MTTDVSDEQLVRNCQQGKSEDFTLLYDRYIRKIYNFIYFKTHHKETAEDLTSETFLKALRSLGSFRVTAGTFQAWLYQIARNSVIDYYRAKKDIQDIDDVWDLGTDDDLPKDLDVKQRLEKVRQLIEDLPAEKREVLILRIWQDLSYKEIAVITSKSEANCKMMVSRALAVFRHNEIFMAMLLIFVINV